ncbi:MULTISPECIES: DUF2786 domain-containing protein [Entomomonas]|uniref:DUF2786 domain-containing protein n=1 Tax=Entomomonas asaccharolytica TaxID=2785331 RepID=A0A974RZ91_9GAMM|nr:MULTISPECIES: DUF2786 domain-containing protein [Entomomonas]QQP86809.1 DUF2786 domain-containing protein [Entomomonas asaccharolytica]UYZ83573.1 DUF2786 domain-containing protein [Entomomonas sp. E2T0]
MNEHNRKDWAIDKIKKCLALYAKSTGNEAETALRQAKSLMEKYGLNETDIKLDDIKECDEAIGTGSGNIPQWITSLATVVAYCFNCQVIFSYKTVIKNYRFSTVKLVSFIGIDSSPELAQYLFVVLKRQLNKDRKKYLNTVSPLCHLATKRKKADLFADHWIEAVTEIIDRFTEFNKEFYQLITQYKDIKYSDRTKIEEKPKTQDKRFDSARLAGHLSGKQVKIHHGIKSDKPTQQTLSWEERHVG